MSHLCSPVVVILKRQEEGEGGVEGEEEGEREEGRRGKNNPASDGFTGKF